jgi:ferredoxin
MLYIDPEECIDCDFAEDQLPDEWQKFAQINANYFQNTRG